MIRFEFTIRLLSGDFEEWKNHDHKILEIVKKHDGSKLRLSYGYQERQVEVSYPDIDCLIRAGGEIRNYFRGIGIEQEMHDSSFNKTKKEMLDTLDKLKQSVAV